MLGLRNRDNGDERIRPEVKEVRDEFLNIYRRTLDNEKDWAKRFTEERSPQTQKDLDVVNDINRQVENLIKAITEKFNIIDSINKDVAPAEGIKKREIVQEYGRSADIIKPYNEIIRKFNSPDINPKTREEIKTSIQQIIPILNQTTSMTKNTFDIKFFDALDAASRNRAKKFLLPMITTFLVMLVIQKNLFRNTYSIIDKPQIDIQYQEWVSSYPQGIRNFLTLIENPTGEAEAEARRGQLVPRQEATDNIRKLEDKLAQSILLIESDRGAPLSNSEKLRLRNMLFGVSSRKFYTPEEIAFLEEEEKRNAEFSERRQEEIEGRTTEAKLRAIAGEQPVEMTPEMPLPEPVGSITTEDITARRIVPVQELTQELQDMLNKQQSLIKASLAFLTPDKQLGAHTVQRLRVRNAIQQIIDVYKKGYKILEDRDPTIAEITQLKDDVINSQTDDAGNPTLTDAVIDDALVFFRGTLQKRSDVYKSLRNAYNDVVDILDNMLEEKTKAIEEQSLVFGKGKPRNKVSQAIHYNEAHNDPYLIR